nr:MAG TPA: hypothetical protein [Caudoviricetes sp.]
MPIDNRMPYPCISRAVLPLEYDESLSYYEVLAKIAKKMNEIIEAVNAMQGVEAQSEESEEYIELM